MPGAVEGRADQLGHAGVQDHLPAGAVTDVKDASHEPAGSGDEGTTGLHREPGRAAISRHPVQERPELAGEALGTGYRLADRPDREPATEVDRIEGPDRAAPQGGQGQRLADGVAPGVDRTEL